MCTYERERVLGEIKDGAMLLSVVGEIAEQCWEEIPRHFTNVELGEFVIMPNHLHGVILLRDIPCGDEVTSSPQERRSETLISKQHPTLGQVVAFYKYQSTKLINVARDAPGTRFWQRNYYEHIIRDGNDLFRIRKYVVDNVSKWPEENENPESDPAKANRM
jgi:putative transposase